MVEAVPACLSSLGTDFPIPCPLLIALMTPRILFLCIGNSCRSQMAEGFARALGSGRLEVYSAGSHPAGIVNPNAVACMKEVGIDLSGHRSKGLKDLPYDRFDVIVGMGCEDACPHFSAGRRVEWKVPDPVGRDLDTFRAVRDQIRGQVTRLLEEWTAVPSSNAKP